MIAHPRGSKMGYTNHSDGNQKSGCLLEEGVGGTG